MYDKVLSKIKTTDDVESLKKEIDVLLESLFDSKEGSLEYTLKNKVRAKVAGAIREEISQKEIDKEKFLRSLREKIENLDTVSLTLAIEPTEGFIQRITQFIERVIGKGVVLDISFNPQIVGGVVIVYKGFYRDFSFKRIFEKHFEERRGELIKMIENKNQSGK